MRALVTGACGFVGGYLARHLLECGDEVVGTFLADPPASHAAHGLQFERVRLDLTNALGCQELVGRVRPEVIYHLAGMAFVPEAEENFDRALLSNVGATNNIVRACHLHQFPTKVVFVSSAEVYGRIRPQDLPLTEETPPKPGNNYSLSKLMAEQLMYRYEQGGFITPLIMRPFNHIGPGQNQRFVASTFARQLATIALGNAAPVLSVGNLAARRDFSDVRDVVRAYRLGAERGRGVYNLGAGRSYAVQEVLDILIEVSGLSVRVEQDPARMRPAEVPEVFGSYAKAERELGWHPTIQLRDSLKAIYDHWLKELSVAA